MDKRGQVAIFVIVALAIVAIILVVFLFPRVTVGTNDVNPSSFLRECMEQDLQESLLVVTRQGGYLQPDNYLLHQGEQIQYLCYTDTPYLPCKVQQPLLITHVQDEITSFMQPRARQCMSELVQEYERRGFSVQSSPGEISVQIVPSQIVVEFLAPMTISKESTQTFQKFSVGTESELYDLLSIATNIIQFESTLGDSETLLYVQYYPNLKIDKINKDEGDTIYSLSDVTTGDSFTFASKSQAWPAGYADPDEL